MFSSILRVPITFPPEKAKNTVLLSGMCVPDLKGTQGSFSFFTTKARGRLQDEAAVMSGENAGGVETIVQREGNVVRGDIEGPPNSMVQGNPVMKLPFTLTLREDGSGGDLELDGETYTLERRKYTDWISVEFPAAPMVKVSGIVRFYLMETDPELQLYMTPIHLDPANPALPISEPAVYSVYLAKRLGSFATLGLAEDTWALNERRTRRAGVPRAGLAATTTSASACCGRRWTRPARAWSLWCSTPPTGSSTCSSATWTRRTRPMRARTPSSSRTPSHEMYARMDELLGRVRAEAVRTTRS